MCDCFCWLVVGVGAIRCGLFSRGEIFGGYNNTYNTCIYVYSIMLFFVRRRGESRFSSAYLLGCEVRSEYAVVSFGSFHAGFPVCHPMFHPMFRVGFACYCGDLTVERNCG